MGAMTMKTSNRWLGLLSVAVTMSSGAAYMSYDTLGSSGSFYSSGGCVTVYQGDGYCDHMNNNAECGFDGGDCCSCTCTATDYYNCGMNGFACVDPGAACVNDDDVTIEVVENCYHPGSIGDGYCDSANNKAVCGYDGGDCCSCTCVVPENSSSYISSYSSAYMSNFLCSASGSGFACIDPAAPCVDDDDITVEMAENCQYIQGVGDGYCDQGNNNEKCGYDGGDCCSCTCTAPENSSQGYGSYGYTCSENAFGSGFACIDPSAECVDDDDITADMVENCGYIQGIGNGYCDHINNNELCGYDGGDCCSCTCTAPETSPDVATSYYGAYYYINYQACGNGFACIDPSATCVNDDDITVDIVENCDPVSVGDAYCDQGNNTPQCNYDGGDCCSCTCEDTPNQQCGEWSGFACIDPSAECVNDDDITVNMFEHCWGGIGDGYCNPDNNKPECNYDGGDCCECTCEVDMSTSYSDGRWSGCTEFACVDPAAPCVDDDSITVGMLDKCPWATGIGNGYCDPELNNADCLYDGGDCCSCTCETAWDDDWACSAVDCKDPSAPCIGEDSNMSYGFGSWDDDTMSHGSYEFADFDDDVAAFAADTGEENAGLRNELPAKNLVLGVALGFLFPLWAFSGC